MPLQLHALPIRLPEVSIGAVRPPRVEHDLGHRWFREILTSVATAG